MKNSADKLITFFSNPRTAPGVALLVGLLSLALAGGAGATPGSGAREIVLVNQPFKCRDYRQPLDLDLVKVTLTASYTGVFKDALWLTSSCTGRIGRVEVDTWIADGIKVVGARDLRIEGGYVRCWDRKTLVHQDGVQVMGGTNVLFRGLDVRCFTANNAAFWLRAGNGATVLPTNVVCEACLLRAGRRALKISESLRSGARNTTVCGATWVRDTAIQPVNEGNRTVAADQCGRTNDPPSVTLPPPPPAPTPPPAPAPSPPPAPAPSPPPAPTQTTNLSIGTVSVTATETDGHRRLAAEFSLRGVGERTPTLACSARGGGSDLALVDRRLDGSRGRCVWRLPDTSRRIYVWGSIRVTAGSSAARRPFLRRV